MIPESRRAFTNDSSGYLARKRTIRGFRCVPGGLSPIRTGVRGIPDRRQNM